MAKALLSTKRRKVMVAVIIVAILGLGGMKLLNNASTASSETVTQQEQRAEIGDITIDYEGDGQAQIDSINLDFDLSGKLKELYVKEGDSIKKGQVLAKLDDAEYQQDLQTARINYQRAVESLEQTKQQSALNLLSEKQKLDELKYNLDQLEAQYIPMSKIPDAYSKQELDAKRMDYEKAKRDYQVQLQRYNTLLNSNEDVKIAETNVESAKIALKVAQDNLAKTVLISPIDAKVLNIAYDPGETVSNPQNSTEVTADTTHFMVISHTNKMNVTVPVAETDLSKVTVGQKVEMNFDAYEGETFTGKVSSIASLPQIDSNNMVTYTATVALDGGYDKIKSGMTCTADFILKQRRNVLVIPNKAVSFIDGKQVVKVKDQNGKLTTREIKTGLTDGKNVEVTQGLRPGETVIIETKTAG